LINSNNDLSRSRCVVFGAGGFIGTNLCKSLVGKVDLLRAFGRSQHPPVELIGCEWIKGDFSNAQSIFAAVEGCDTVFHLVNTSTPASSNVDILADLQGNVCSSLNLLNICREAGIKRIIFVSSGGTIYGIPKLIPTPETEPTNPITAYGVCKLTIEKYLGLYEYLYGLEYRVLRVANPFGPYQNPQKNQGVIAAFINRALEGKSIDVWGDGNVIRDYIYIDDVVNALELAVIHEGDGRVFNIGSGEGHSLNNIINLIENIIENKISIDRKSARSIDVPVSILDISFALKNLCWEPTINFHDGLQNTLDWYKTKSM
jgi:UDP-glucose 4-epimerase